jgi:hypothetical protein
MGDNRNRTAPEASVRDITGNSIRSSRGFFQTLIVARMAGDAFEVLRRMTFLLLVTVAFIFLVAFCFCIGYGYGDEETPDAAKTAGWVMLTCFLLTGMLAFLTPIVFMPVRGAFAQNILDRKNTPR